MPINASTTPVPNIEKYWDWEQGLLPYPHDFSWVGHQQSGSCGAQKGAHVLAVESGEQDAS
jgi:hypothetical protein